MNSITTFAWAYIRATENFFSNLLDLSFSRYVIGSRLLSRARNMLAIWFTDNFLFYFCIVHITLLAASLMETLYSTQLKMLVDVLYTHGVEYSAIVEFKKPNINLKFILC